MRGNFARWLQKRRYQKRLIKQTMETLMHPLSLHVMQYRRLRRRGI
jgi:hypothetical protein